MNGYLMQLCITYTASRTCTGSSCEDCLTVCYPAAQSCCIPVTSRATALWNHQYVHIEPIAAGKPLQRCGWSPVLPASCHTVEQGSPPVCLSELQGTCNGSQILQSLPQSTEHFALAEYDSSTACEEVREPMPRGRFTTKKELSLEFVALDDQISQLVPYTVCMDTSWRAGDFEEQIVGPVSTYVFLDNRCTNGSASVAIQLVRDASAPRSTSTSPSILFNRSSASLQPAVLHVCSVVCHLGEASESTLPRKQDAR